ncbi:hypothetical protein HDE_00571 [Halotydeus destructor]|nr:hypothetical protein HDE_00571 [Halotydeus destructor]
MNTKMYLVMLVTLMVTTMDAQTANTPAVQPTGDNVVRYVKQSPQVAGGAAQQSQDENMVNLHKVVVPGDLAPGAYSTLDIVGHQVKQVVNVVGAAAQTSVKKIKLSDAHRKNATQRIHQAIKKVQNIQKSSHRIAGDPDAILKELKQRVYATQQLLAETHATGETDATSSATDAILGDGLLNEILGILGNLGSLGNLLQLPAEGTGGVVGDLLVNLDLVNRLRSLLSGDGVLSFLVRDPYGVLGLDLGSLVYYLLCSVSDLLDYLLGYTYIPELGAQIDATVEVGYSRGQPETKGRQPGKSGTKGLFRSDEKSSYFGLFRLALHCDLLPFNDPSPPAGPWLVDNSDWSGGRKEDKPEEDELAARLKLMHDLADKISKAMRKEAARSLGGTFDD